MCSNRVQSAMLSLSKKLELLFVNYYYLFKKLVFHTVKMSSNWEQVALFSTENDKDLKKNGNIKIH